MEEQDDSPPCECQACITGQRQRLVPPYCPDKVPTVHSSPCSCFECSKSYLSHYKQTRGDIKYTGIVPEASVKTLPKLFFSKIKAAKEKLGGLMCSEGNQGELIATARWRAMSVDARRSLLRVAVPDMPEKAENWDSNRQPKKPSAPYFKTCQRERFRFLVWGRHDDLVRNRDQIRHMSAFILTNGPSYPSAMQDHYFSEGYLDIWFAPQLVVMEGSGTGQVVPWNERRAHAEPSDVLGFPRALALLEGHLLLTETIIAIYEAVLKGPSHEPGAPLAINAPVSRPRSPAALESPPAYVSQDLPPAYASPVSSPTCGSDPALPPTAGSSNSAGCVPDMPDEKPARQQPKGGRRRKRGSKSRNKKNKKKRRRRQRTSKSHPPDELDDSDSEESDSDDETSDSEDESVCSEETIKPDNNESLDSEAEEAEAISTSLYSRLNKGKLVARNGSSAIVGSKEADLGSAQELQQGADPPLGSQNSTSVPFRPSLGGHLAKIAKLQAQDRQISAPRDLARRDNEYFDRPFQATPAREKIKTRGVPNLSGELPFREDSDDQSDHGEKVTSSDRVISLPKRSLEIMHMIFPQKGEIGPHEVH